MAVNLSPVGNDAPFFDSSGNPLSGGKLYFYTAGSSTPQNTYTTSAGSVANANPVILDSAGYPASGGSVVEIWFTAGVSYKAVLKTSADVTLWTRDNLVGINDTTVTIDQWVSGPAPTYIGATSFSLVGDQTSTFQVGRRLKTTNAGGTIYSTITASVFGAVTTVTVVNDSGSLDSGLSAVSYALLSATNPSVPDIFADSDGIVVTIPAGLPTFRGVSQVAGGRITLTTAVPVTTSDVTGATTVYYTPYQSNEIMVYDGTNWVPIVFSELSQTTSDSTKSPAAVANNSNYDLFVWVDSGTTRCTRGPVWTSDTARGTGAATTELEFFEGRYVNKVAITNGPAARRGLYVGTIRSDGSAQINDSFAKRHVWNAHNRVTRPMRVTEATDTWTYTTAAFRQANASTANQLDMVIGISEDTVSAHVRAGARNDGTAAAPVVGIGLDSTTTLASGAICMKQQITTANVIFSSFQCDWKGFPGIGRHYLAWLEYSSAAGTTTWIGDNGEPTLVQSGIHGEMRG